jgi:hypothetical protein
MKKILALAVTLAFAMPVVAADAQPETKRVCVTTTDAKTKKEVEKCRTVKVHKKHEGTKVPEKAPAKKPAAKPEPKK